MQGPSPPTHTVILPVGMAMVVFSNPIFESAIRLNIASTLSGRFHTIHTHTMITTTINTPITIRTFSNFLPIFSPRPDHREL